MSDIVVELNHQDAHLVAWACAHLASYLLEHPDEGLAGDAARATEICAELRRELFDRGVVPAGVD